MLDGFGYIFGQIVVLFVLALAIGVLLGRYLLPRATGHTDPTEPAPSPATESPFPGHLPSESAGTSDPLARLADAEARIAYAQTRYAQADARRAELEARLTEAQTQLTHSTTGLAGLQGQVTQSRGEVEQSRAQLAQVQAVLAETRRQLTDADAEVVRLRLQARELADRKEAEMGRLESGAIAALESTIATHQEQVARLEERLKAAEHSAQERVQDLAIERRRAEQLQAALAERDQHVANLNAGEGDRPSGTSRPGTGTGTGTGTGKTGTGTGSATGTGQTTEAR